MSGNPGTLLGFDYGKKRIGVALGQTLTGSARPLASVAVRGDQPDWAQIAELLAAWRPEALVVGLPQHMDDREHALAAPVRAFAAQLQGRYGLPVHLIDERLSSHEASQRAAQSGRRKTPGSRAAKEELDRLAAQVILESWLADHAHRAGATR